MQRGFVMLAACLAMACAGDLPTTGNVPMPAALSIVSGHRQEGFPRRPLADSLRVRVTDASGAPVPGARVAWEPGDASGTTAPEISIAGPDGVAATAWTPGDAPSPTLRARVVNRDIAANFSAEVSGFTFECEPGTVTNNRGDLRALACAASAVGAFAAPVSLSVMGAPPGFEVNLPTGPLELGEADGPVTVSAILSIGPAVPSGAHTVTLRGVAGADTVLVPLSVTIR